MKEIGNFVAGAWQPPAESGRRVMRHAVTGDEIGVCSADAVDFGEALAWARETGGPALRAMTFHERARMVKALALFLNERKEELYALNPATGATRKDGWIDIDGGIQTLFVYASKGRRELPDKHVALDGEIERISRHGTFLGQHVWTSLQGAAVHINAFNFPCWGMLEKLAPTLIAGVPAIVKPATPTAFLAHRLFELIIESGLLPEGAAQFVAGGVGDLLDRLGCQDVVAFTGSASTADHLRHHTGIIERGVRFTAETDSLNAAVLAPDAAPGTPEFDLFVKEVVREMTVKAGQKCTAIRRALVPAEHLDTVREALVARLAKVVVGNPENEKVTMGALVGRKQRDEVREHVRALADENPIIFGDPDHVEVIDGDPEQGAFMGPVLMQCGDGLAASRVHDTEAFGPVSTLIAYRDLEEAAALVNRGGGSLVSSLFTHSGEVAAEMVARTAAFNGRLYVMNRDSAREATGHGSPLPHLVHGGPGHAGGGEELGGVRGVFHYMQRTAIQGSPDILTAITGRWVPGAKTITDRPHPFTRDFDTLVIGETFVSPPREVTMEDIEHFAEFTGDTFYAHMDEEAAKANPFFDGRVAHGYLLLSFAAGLFVEPNPGPVLANTGLDHLRFMKPVYPGTPIHVELTVKDKTPRNDDHGEVRWHVRILDDENEVCAEYELLTMNARAGAAGA